jgi:hypothetical protein
MVVHANGVVTVVTFYNVIILFCTYMFFKILKIFREKKK